MIFNLSKQDTKKLKTLFETLETNIGISDFYISLIDNAKFIARKIQIRQHFNDKVFFNAICKTGFALPDILSEKENDYQLSDIRHLELHQYINDPYFQRIHIENSHIADWKISYSSYLPYEIFVWKENEIIDSTYFREKTYIGFFEKPFDYIVVSQKKVPWMSITPNEIETMKLPIEQAKGTVLVLGLGLGYFPYMCSLKSEVNQVVIVEKDQNIIELFQTQILPQFEYREKIIIVNGDAYDFINKNSGSYNMTFIDLWHTVEDGLEMYVKMIQQEKKNFGVYYYWIEKSMLMMIRRCLIALLEEEYDGLPDSAFWQSNCFSDKLINSLHCYFRSRKFTKYDEIRDTLQDFSLRQIAKNLKI